MDAETFIEGVTSLLDWPVLLVERESASVMMIGEVQKKDDRWTLYLRFEDSVENPLGTRTIESSGDQCRELDNTAALVASLAIESLRQEIEQRALESEAPESEKPTGGKKTSTGLSDTPKSVAKRQDLGLALGAAFDLTYDFLPSVSFGVSLYGLLEIVSNWSLWIKFSAWPPREVVNEESMGGRFWGLTGFAGGCYRIWNRGLSGCAGLGISTIRATGVGLQRNDAMTAVGFVPYLGLDFAIPLGPVTFRPSAGACFNATPNEFGFALGSTSDTLVHRTAVVFPLIGLGMEVPL